MDSGCLKEDGTSLFSGFQDGGAPVRLGGAATDETGLLHAVDQPCGAAAGEDEFVAKGALGNLLAGLAAEPDQELEHGVVDAAARPQGRVDPVLEASRGLEEQTEVAHQLAACRLCGLCRLAFRVVTVAHQKLPFGLKQVS